MKNVYLILFLTISYSTLFGQDYKKVGKVAFNARFMAMSDDNQYVASVKDEAIIHIESGEKYKTDFKFLKFIPNEDKYIGYKKEGKVYVEVDIKLGTVDTLFKLDKTFMVRNNPRIKISPDRKYVGIKCISTRTGGMVHTVLLLDREKKKEIKQLSIPKGYYTFAFTNDSKTVVYLDVKKQNGSAQHFINEYNIEDDDIFSSEIFGIKLGMKIGNELMHITNKNQFIFTLEESGRNMYIAKYDFDYEELKLSESFTTTQLKTRLSSVGFDQEKNQMIRSGYSVYTWNLDTLELVYEQRLKYKSFRCVSIDGKYVVSAKDEDSTSSVLLSRKNN